MGKRLKRTLIVVATLYFAIAAYGRYHKPPEIECSCDACVCVSSGDIERYEQGATP
jgi:hypothetical protein